MLPTWLKKNNNVSLLEFLIAVKKGERDFFKILNTNEENFTDASFDQLMSNTDDVIAGVNRVQTNFSEFFFNTFENSLVKHHDNGDFKLVFYTTTTDPNLVIKFSDVLFSELGIGFFDDRRFTPFTNHQKIKSLSKSIFQNEDKDIVHSWPHENISFVLQYKTDPLCQFSLMVNITAPKNHDTSIRRNGTILDLLDFNIDHILNNEPILVDENSKGNEINFIDYTYKLERKQFAVFDMITIRLFDELRSFTTNIQTHVTLYSSKPIEPETKIEVVEKLLKIYGQDIYGSQEIKFHERDILEASAFWTGRTWQFNNKHGLWSSQNNDAPFAYDVRIDDMEETIGFKLFISRYNELVSLFGIS